ncbi:TIGR02206 family membrane protein [Planomicrobium sp. YIM 101495]|uniref:YwaF family protein n=1 Tax=Planomicrobium sp. YIM 101495 TaxID=2665160 RepID=UPI0012B9B989|nr:TIGR02206 family membrane protein [Planomicrobium sp. YIM 101495]MTD31333.1 TIGR02206 family membrane protein [Planomicrobium sp. YIM 101495]
MSDWFGLTSTSMFEPFGLSHWLVLLIATAGLFILVSAKKPLQHSPESFQWLRWLLFTLLVLSEVSYQIWTISNGIWSFAAHVPLHLCGVASITAAIALVTLNKRWIQISFFIGIAPAFLALVTPDVPYDYEHYRFWKFFVHHTTIPWACLFLALTKPPFITFRSVFFVYGLLLAYAFVIGVFVNPLIDANYLYLEQTPTADTLLNVFGEGWFYYINLSLTALGVFLLQYGVWRFIHDRNIRSSNHR